MKKVLFSALLLGMGILLGSILFQPAESFAAAFVTALGGTGTSSPSGILYGDNNATTHLNTVIIGTGLSFSGGTLTNTVGAASFPFTPVAGGNSTTTTLIDTQGFVAGASTTFSYLSAGLGYLTSTGKFLSTATGTESISSPLTGSSFTVVGSGSSIGCQTASGSQAGCLSSSDWTTFNTKISTSSAITSGQLAYYTGLNNQVGGISTTTLGGSGVISVTAGATTLGGSPITISCPTCGTGSVTSVGLSTPNSTLTLGGTNPVTTSGTISADLNLGNANTWTASSTWPNINVGWIIATNTAQKSIFQNASTTYLSAATELNAPHSGTVPTLAPGDVYVNTNSVASSSVAFGTAANHNLFSTHSFSGLLGSSTLVTLGNFSATASTTIVIANPLHASTLQSFFCKTDQGTAYLAFGNGSATTTRTQCTSSGVNTVVLSNNTWGGRQSVYLEAGTSASAPNYITFTADVEDSN